MTGPAEKGAAVVSVVAIREMISAYSLGANPAGAVKKGASQHCACVCACACARKANNRKPQRRNAARSAQGAALGGVIAATLESRVGAFLVKQLHA